MSVAADIIPSRRARGGSAVIGGAKVPPVPQSAVVAGEEHERVVAQPVPVQRFQDPTERPVRLEYKVTVETGATAARANRSHRQVRRRQWHVQEEGLVPAGLLVDQELGFLGQPRQHVLHSKASRAHPGCQARKDVRPAGRNGYVWNHLHGAIPQEAVRAHVEGGGNPEERVESNVQGPSPQFSRVIHIVAGAKPACPTRHWIAALVEPAHAEMPLPHGCGTVAGALQQQRDSVVLPRVDQRRAEPVQDPAGERRPPRIAPGQQAVTRRRTDRRRAVGIREAHALARQPVDVGRGNLGRGLVRLRVAPAHVIRQHDDDVRQLCAGDCREES